MTSVFLAMAALFSIKNSLVTLLTGLLYEDQVKLHRVFAVYTLILGYSHSLRIVY